MELLLDLHVISRMWMMGEAWWCLGGSGVSGEAWVTRGLAARGQAMRG